MAETEQRTRSAGSGERTWIVVTVLVIAGLLLAILGGVLSSRFSTKADEIWNREGCDKAYRDTLATVEKKYPLEPVNEESVRSLARERMRLPGYVPPRAKEEHKKANILGVVEIFGFLLLVLTVIRCLFIERKEIYRRIARR